MTLAAVSALTAFTVPQAGMAADLPELEPFPEVSVSFWEGFYAGIHLGGGSSSWGGIQEGNDAPGFVGLGSELNPQGFVGGGQIGYNFLSGNFLFGVEADFSFTEWDDRYFDPGDFDDFIEADVEWLATVRGRAGYAFDRFMVYGTAGIAFVDATFTAFDDTSGVAGSIGFDDVGFVFGGGGAFALTERLSLGIDALYYDFGDSASAAALTPDSAPGDFAAFDDAFVVRAALNYRFGGGFGLF